MTEQPYPPLRPQPPVRRRTRPNPLPMIAGVAVLAVLAIALLAILLTRDPDGTAGGSASPSPSASATGSGSAAESPSPGASASAGSTDAASIGQLELLSVVAAAVEGVTLREDPGTGGRRIGELAEGAQNIVLEGPIEADGYAWYRLSAIGLPPSSGCITPLPTEPLECPIWLGWAAAGEPADGTAWFEEVAVDCPDPDAATDEFMSLPRRLPLACYRDADLSFTAWYPEPPAGGSDDPDCEADPAIEWLYCSGPSVWPDPEEAAAFVSLHVDPDTGISLPEPGQWLRVSGAFDHPDASGCAEANPDDDSDPLAVLECRVGFVVSAVEVTSAP